MSTFCLSCGVLRHQASLCIVKAQISMSTGLSSESFHFLHRRKHSALRLRSWPEALEEELRKVAGNPFFKCSFSLYPLFDHTPHISHALCLVYSAQELNHSVFWRNKSQVTSITRQRYFLVVWSGQGHWSSNDLLFDVQLILLSPIETLLPRFCPWLRLLGEV